MMFRRFLVVLILILAIALVACGSNDKSGTSGQPDATSSTAEAATAEPPTETPVPPTATPAPTPTLAPTPTEIAEETTQGGSANAGSGWGASGSGAQSACDHPYLPLRLGASWTFEGTEGPLTWEVTDVQGDMDAATAVMDVTVGDLDLTYHWQCTTGQGLTSFDFANLSSAVAGLDLTLEQISVDGEFLLPAEQMIPGATWTAEMLGNVSMSEQAGDTTIEVTGEMKTVQQHTITSNDPVEVDGQNVPGLQLEQVANITLNLLLMGTNSEQTITLNNNFVLGYGIGVVTQSSVTDFGTRTLNLVEYSIP